MLCQEEGFKLYENKEEGDNRWGGAMDQENTNSAICSHTPISVSKVYISWSHHSMASIAQCGQYLEERECI
jgi:hypothetical protein